MSWRGVFAGALALIALEAIVRTADSAGRFGDLFRVSGQLIESALSPSVPLVPDLAGVGTTTYGDTPNDGGSGLGGGGGGGGGGGSW